MNRRRLCASSCLLIATLSVPLPVSSGGAPGRVAPAGVFRPDHSSHAARHVGLGKILSTQDGGQIFGFDIDQAGTDGLLASAQTVDQNGDMRVSVETFDQNSGDITKSFAREVGKKNSYAVDGIFAGDVGLVTHFVTPKGSIFATRHYELMNPVTAGMFTGKWTPPVNDVDVQQRVENQSTATDILFVIELKNQDRPDLLVSNVAANTFGKLFHLDPNLFGGGNGPQLGAYAAANTAVFALSPDGGRVGGAPPINVLIDLNNGKTTQFAGFNNGAFGSGFVNGLAVDPNSGIAATTTELNAQVEFYDIGRRTGIAAVQLPCTGPESQSNSGAGIAIDRVHRLFLVADPFYCDGSQGGALVIYDERGSLVETITGFTFAIAEPPVVINPATRMGWAFGPQFSQLQQFFY